MQLTEKNLKWGTVKLSRFKDWPGFPKSEEGLKFRVELFVRMVRNQTMKEINQGLRPDLDWDAEPSKLGNATNDADWLLEVVAQTCERFPPHATMRKLYRQYLPLPDDEQLRPIFDVLNPD